MNQTYEQGADYSFAAMINNAPMRAELVHRYHGIAVAWDYTALWHQKIPHCVVRPMFQEGFGCDVYLAKAPGTDSEKIRIFEKAVKRWIQQKVIANNACNHCLQSLFATIRLRPAEQMVLFGRERQ